MTVEQCIERALAAAYDFGRAGRAFPRIPEITADASEEDIRLLAHAWTLRQFPHETTTTEDIEAVDDFLVSLALRWQDGQRAST